MTAPSPAQAESFYRAGALGLRALEAREGRGRRLGPAADATWRAFRGDPGELDDRDRLDILLRDAAATSAIYPLAFAPRRIFALPGLSDDEPFGHEWPGLSLGLATSLLREAAADLAPRPAHVVLAEVASAWGLAPGATRFGTPVASLGRASHVAAAGAGAVLALAEHFSSRDDLDFGDQVLYLTDRPGERQLFGLAVVLLGKPTAPRVALPDVARQDGARTLGFDRITAVLVSEDAAASAREAALELGQQGGVDLRT